MTSLLIVEDHTALGNALARALKQVGNIEVAGTASTAQAAIDLLDALKVDLALVDVSMPDKNGIQLVAELQQLHPEVPCLMMSGHTAAHYVQRSLEAGARGYVIKDNLEGILEGIRHVLAGEIYVSPEISED